MFSIYKRFDSDGGPGGGREQSERLAPNMSLAYQGGNRQMANSSPQRAVAFPKQHGQGLRPSLAEGQTKTKGPAFEGATNQNQRQVPQGYKNPRLSTQQKALPPPRAHREDHKEQAHRHRQKSRGFLQGFLPSGIYDSKSKKLFGFLAAEDLLLVALIFLLLEKDGEDNTLMILALVYVLLSDYIDLPELGF